MGVDRREGSEFIEGDISHLQIGMPVNHKTYGPGIVISKTLFFVNVHFEIGNKMFPLKKQNTSESLLAFLITEIFLLFIKSAIAAKSYLFTSCHHLPVFFL